MSERMGLGLYRGPQAIPDDVAPGGLVVPSEGHPGPPVSLPLESWQEWLRTIDRLGEQLALTTRPDFVAGTVVGNTDDSGNLILPVYQVAAGMEATLSRLTINAVNPSTGVPYTPGAPYTSTEAYVELHVVDDPSNVGFTSLADFEPRFVTGVGVTPMIFPYLFADSQGQATFARGPMWFVLQCVTGVVSSVVMARYQLRLKRARGVS